MVAILLLQIRDEELTFWTFVAVMKDLKWRYNYLDNTPKLLKIVASIEERLKKEHGQLYKHLVENDVPFIAILSHFFMTVFSYSLPIRIAVRIFDVFLFGKLLDIF